MNSNIMRHVVMFGFNEDATNKEVDGIVEAFYNLEQLIDGVVSIEAGTNVSPEGLNKGLTHCFIVTFNTEQGRDDYLVHPEHLSFVEQLKPHLKDVCVLDFWV